LVVPSSSSGATNRLGTYGNAGQRVVDTYLVRFRRVAGAAALALAVCTGCSNASPDVRVTNSTTQTIRLSGNCIDDDAYMLSPGATVNGFYLGAQCRIDNGDGRDGMLGCVTLKAKYTDIAQADLRNPPGPNQCWGSGTRH
jgi:hypothetical protein